MRYTLRHFNKILSLACNLRQLFLSLIEQMIFCLNVPNLVEIMAFEAAEKLAASVSPPLELSQ